MSLDTKKPNDIFLLSFHKLGKGQGHLGSYPFYSLPFPFCTLLLIPQEKVNLSVGSYRQDIMLLSQYVLNHVIISVVSCNSFSTNNSLKPFLSPSFLSFRLNFSFPPPLQATGVYTYHPHTHSGFHNPRNYPSL